ncbi:MULTISPECIES: type III secretion system export apparatus subunit SctU [Burkholderiaceae]|uniref:type III secretion system export apparatus subunit SctU n=1 Tax=Burkholderiaceae TaxID=119060 RepID=UPI001420196B|nr:MULTISPECIES: type III secretion system export apparatus subunit SctU [Burkholderiaceae]MBN3851593.1 EscU/YscU/HrcU family type III secretion system export apparatus switch protein [Paraburkholderia sp. Ac-20342]NIF54063.1 EscU/YscU/HrcU family type III secretion system export apparatus switch protein [Burkholderia sp. Ax-1724]NIF81716.1 EscU/YscU/HrcU family type III secretion system export apparatus switch protein [Paraburkholderia sp. Cy-641]
MSDDKTEEPSEKKLRDAREEGQVAKSTDLVEVAPLGALLLTFTAGQRYLTDSLRAVVNDALDFTHGDRTLQDLSVTLSDMGFHAIGLLCGIAAIALVAAVLALFPQVGFVISLKAVNPKLDAISPASGLKKIFGMNALIDLAKMTVKAIVLMAVMWSTIKSSMPVVASSLDETLARLIEVLWSVVTHLVTVALGVFIVIGAVDYKLQHWQFIRKNRMSKDEVKREHKDSEGNQEVKGERKRIAREMSQEEPKRGVGRASVVVVNPVHYAVALRYDPVECPLPIVIAKGLDDEALLLRRYATESGVPIVANPPVARMLHKVPEKQPVPEELFEVVAAILKWVDGIGTQPARTEK